MPILMRDFSWIIVRLKKLQYLFIICLLSCSGILETDLNAAPKVKRVAICDFSGPTDNISQGAKGIADLLVAELSTETNIDLVERSEITKVLNEQKISLSTMSDPASAVAVGKLLGADLIVVGFVFKNIGTHIAVVKVIDAKSSVVREMHCLRMGEVGLDDGVQVIKRLVKKAVNLEYKDNQKRFIGIGSIRYRGSIERNLVISDQIKMQLEEKYSKEPGYVVVERTLLKALLQEIELRSGFFVKESGTSGKPAVSSFVMSCDYTEVAKGSSELTAEVKTQLPGGKEYRYSVQAKSSKELLEKIDALADKVMKSATLEKKKSDNKLEAKLHYKEGLFVGNLRYGFDTASGSNIETLRPVLMFGRFGLLGSVDDSPFSYGRYWPTANIKHAIAAFESTVLLDPEKEEAKLLLGLCLAHDKIREFKRSERILEDLMKNGKDETIRYAAAMLLWKDEEIEVSPKLAPKVRKPEFVMYSRHYKVVNLNRRYGNKRLSRETAIEVIKASLSAKMNFMKSRIESGEELWSRAYGSMIIPSSYSDYGMIMNLYEDDMSGLVKQVEIYKEFKKIHPKFAPYLLLQYGNGTTMRYGDYVRSKNDAIHRKMFVNIIKGISKKSIDVYDRDSFVNSLVLRIKSILKSDYHDLIDDLEKALDTAGWKSSYIDLSLALVNDVEGGSKAKVDAYLEQYGNTSIAFYKSLYPMRNKDAVRMVFYDLKRCKAFSSSKFCKSISGIRSSILKKITLGVVIGEEVTDSALELKINELFHLPSAMKSKVTWGDVNLRTERTSKGLKQIITDKKTGKGVAISFGRVDRVKEKSDLLAKETKRIEGIVKKSKELDRSFALLHLAANARTSAYGKAASLDLIMPLIDEFIVRFKAGDSRMPDLKGGAGSTKKTHLLDQYNQYLNDFYAKQVDPWFGKQHYDLWLTTARSYASGGKYKKAIDAYYASSKIAEGNHGYREYSDISAARLHMLMGESKQAISLLEEYITKRDPLKGQDVDLIFQFLKKYKCKEEDYTKIHASIVSQRLNYGSLRELTTATKATGRQDLYIATVNKSYLEKAAIGDKKAMRKIAYELKGLGQSVPDVSDFVAAAQSQLEKTANKSPKKELIVNPVIPDEVKRLDGLLLELDQAKTVGDSCLIADKLISAYGDDKCVDHLRKNFTRFESNFKRWKTMARLLEDRQKIDAFAKKLQNHKSPYFQLMYLKFFAPDRYTAGDKDAVERLFLGVVTVAGKSALPIAEVEKIFQPLLDVGKADIRGVIYCKLGEVADKRDKAKISVKGQVKVSGEDAARFYLAGYDIYRGEKALKGLCAAYQRMGKKNEILKLAETHKALIKDKKPNWYTCKMIVQLYDLAEANSKIIEMCDYMFEQFYKTNIQGSYRGFLMQYYEKAGSIDKAINVTRMEYDKYIKSYPTKVIYHKRMLDEIKRLEALKN